MKVIGLDVGRHRVKVYSDERLISFPSFSGDYRELRLERTMTKEDFVVELDGRYYYVGSVAADESNDGVQSFLTSKANRDTYLLGLTAIHQMVENGEQVHVVHGHPVANHRREEREMMRQLFEGTKELTVNGVRKKFHIGQVTVTAECACTTYLLPQKQTIAYGIDGGGATTNFVTWKKGMWIDKLSGTLPFGLDNSDLTIERYARLVAIETTKAVHQFQGTIYTMGGIATQLAQSLKSYIRNVPIIPLEDGAFANAKAYYTVGTMVGYKLQAQR